MFDCDILDNNKKRRIRKADVFFILAVLAAALISLFILRLHSTEGSRAIVSYDGTQLMRISLGQSEPRYFLFTYGNSCDGNTDSLNSNVIYSSYVNNTMDDSASHTELCNVNIEEFSEEEWQEVQIPTAEYNAFLYQNGEIRMLQSSCPDKICVHHKAISMTGENIICLPHKLVIEVSGESGNEERGLDGVAY